MLTQPPFLNACVQVRTSLEPEELLDACKDVERAVGRTAGGPRHGPRIVDHDILLLGDIMFASERLRLPLRDVISRRCVLVPLLELDPKLELPDGTRAAEPSKR